MLTHSSDFNLIIFYPEPHYPFQIILIRECDFEKSSDCVCGERISLI